MQLDPNGRPRRRLDIFTITLGLFILFLFGLVLYSLVSGGL